MDWKYMCPKCVRAKDKCACPEQGETSAPGGAPVVKPMLIYVAGPYTAANFGGEQRNTDRAMDVALAIIRKGHYPVVPHLSHYLDHRHAYHTGERLPWQFWMAMDDALLAKCDAFYFIAPSKGALIELDRARELELILFSSIEEIPDVSQG